jgi:hypothetical protein
MIVTENIIDMLLRVGKFVYFCKVIDYSDINAVPCELGGS